MENADFLNERRARANMEIVELLKKVLTEKPYLRFEQLRYILDHEIGNYFNEEPWMTMNRWEKNIVVTGSDKGLKNVWVCQTYYKNGNVELNKISESKEGAEKMRDFMLKYDDENVIDKIEIKEWIVTK